MKLWVRSIALFATLAAMFAPAVPVTAADNAPSGRATFYKDVLPILQHNCQDCHRPGGDNIAGMVAPMSFMTYAETRPWAKSLAREVQARRMPPWFAGEAQHGFFKNERRLEEQEIATLVRWARSGAAPGRPEEGPAPLVFEGNNGWMAGEPDLIVEFDEPYWVADDVEDQYFGLSAAIPLDKMPRDRWLRSIEWRGGSDVVHHIVGSASAELSDGTTERAELGSIAPGEEATILTPGFGKLLRAASTIYFSMHYHKEPGPGTGVWDRSKVGFRFWDEAKDPPVQHIVHRNGISARGPWEIPPGHPNWMVGAARTFDVDTMLISMHPHMHLRGKDAKYIAVYPDGRRETLLDVPFFDFNWQLDYTFNEPRRVPAGTRVEFTVHYDNSTDNPYNPDPTIPMGSGRATSEEMMIGYITYCDTEPTEVEWKAPGGE